MNRWRFLITALLPCQVTFGQTYNFRPFTEEEGLPQNYVYCVSQKSDGVLVCSTGESACTFNGYEFSVITPTSLSANFIGTHYVDPADRVWLGHSQGGVTMLDGSKSTSFSMGKLGGSKVTAICPGEEASVIAATSGGGLFRLDTTGKIIPLKGAPEYIGCILHLEKDLYLAGTMEGLVMLRLRGASAKVLRIPGLEDDVPLQIVKAYHNLDCYWVLTQQNKIYGVRKGGYSCHITGQVSAGLIGEDPLTCIWGGSSGELWAGLSGKGALRIQVAKKFPQGSVSSQTINAENGLSTTQVQTIFEDREGNIWFGTFGDGLIQKPAVKFIYYGRNEGLGDPNISAVLPVTQEIAWLGHSSGLSHYNRINHTSTLFNGANGFVNDKVTALSFDGKGRLWVGTGNSGVYIMDTASRRFSIADEQIKHHSVNCITSYDGRVLIGTTEGMFIIDVGSGETEALHTNEGLLHNNVRHIFVDIRERMWVSSHGAPPYFIKDGHVIPFRKVRGLSTFNVNSVCEDARGNIWIATEGDGIFYYNNSDFVNYTAKNGLYSNFCSGIIIDRNNTVWVTHKGGLSERMSGREEFISHNSKRGLIFSQNNLNALGDDGLGSLWFGTTNGLVYYSARSRTGSGLVPTIAINKLLLNDQPVDHTRPIKADYGQYSLRVEYLAVCLYDPSSIVYHYRLPAIDSSWTVTEDRSISFPKLGDGNYDFEVVACSRNNGLCSSPVKFSLTIAMPLWKRPWFYLLLFAGVSVLTYAIVYLRTLQLKRSQLLLQLKVKQKTFLLQREKQAVEAIKIELEEKNKDITDSINYAKRIQDSILPPDEYLAELFGDQYFVLFRPKDIVSGDFYWASELNVNQNNKMPLSLAAVVDCTGHGVPGAFLSIMANDFLKQSIIEESVNRPDEVLNFLNASISSHLNQSSKSQIRDGMDIALIGIDRRTEMLYYSGANNPIYVYRQMEDGIDQIILMATKQAIGMVTDETVPFSIRELQLQKGDTVYLFSDGYADQFGGPNNKKLGYKRFREILLSCFHLPMNEQKRILDEEFEKWKGEGHQIDDVCVMGIRV